MENEPLIFFFVFVVAILVFFIAIKVNRSIAGKIIVQQDHLSQPDISSAQTVPDKLVADNDNWILKLEPSIQLLLALRLAAIALPCWEQYIKKNKVAYIDSLSKKKIVIPEFFLEAALQTIKDNSSVMLLYDNIKYDDIKKKLDQFTYPMTALHDGDLVLPQPIKKIFTGVYNMLKGIEQTNNPLFGHFFSIAITDLIHSIELNQLLSLKEMHLFLRSYKNKIAL